MFVDIAGHRLSVLWLIVDALATYRLTRLLTYDTLLTVPREWVINRWQPRHERLAELAVCAWCLSVWIGAGTVALTVWAAQVWVWPAVVLALSAVAGYLSERA